MSDFNHQEASYPITYRQKDSKEIFERIFDRDSTLLLSIPAAGKSTYLRFITYKKMLKEKYLEDEAARTLMVLIDLNELQENSSKALFELLSRKILENIETQLLIDSKFRINQTIPYFDQLKSIISILYNKHHLYVVLIIDRFDILCRDFDKLTFNNLKSLRDSFKNNLCYLFASGRDPLQVSELSKIGQLYELVAASIYFLRPLNDTDADYIIKRETENRRVSLDEAQIETIRNLCDGHPGLIKAVLQYIDQKEDTLNWDTLPKSLSEFSGVRLRLEKIWRYLSNEERAILRRLVMGDPVSTFDQKFIELLDNKGLIVKDTGSNYLIFCQLFSEYIQSLKEPISKKAQIPEKGLYLDKYKRHIFKNGRILKSELSKSEYKLLEFFFDNTEKICSREEIIRAVWGDDLAAGVSDEAIDQIISRLRGKIEDERSNPQFIITIRGRGFKFINKS